MRCLHRACRSLTHRPPLPLPVAIPGSARRGAQWTEFAAKEPAALPFVAVSSGISDADFRAMSSVLDAVPGVEHICLDVANGYRCVAERAGAHGRWTPRTSVHHQR